MNTINEITQIGLEPKIRQKYCFQIMRLGWLRFSGILFGKIKFFV